jgi:hypothetical protein
MLGEDTEGLDTIAFDSGTYEVPPPEKEKLHALAQALGKRPQLKVVVQGRYSQESDGFALKAMNVRRSLAVRLGLALDEGEDPGPLDYGDPDIQLELESMYGERFSAESLAALKRSLQESAPTEGQKKEAASSSPSEDTHDPGLVSKALYAALIETEPLDESALIELADTRSQAIIFEIVGQGKLAPERTTTKAPEALKTGEPVAAKLELEAL